MLVDEFDYYLPPELIAQEPAAQRDSSRLMLVPRRGGRVEHRFFSDLPQYLKAGDVLVLNDTRVYPARLTGKKAGTGGTVEALLLKDMGGGMYNALMKGGPRPGARIIFDGGLTAVVVEDTGGGKRLIRFEQTNGLGELIERHGRMPLPPYIDQTSRTEDEDRQRYQTVYAKKRGAVAAPTAGLHFTPELLARIKARGVVIATVTLHVGIGTFMPVRVSNVDDHVMEREEYEVSAEAAKIINSAKAAGGRIVAVGTTSARTLESAAGEDGVIKHGASDTGLFIYPGYRFKAVDALVTNFHLPKSTLLMLVCAFAGKANVMAAYEEAVKSRYRFYSYGDATFFH